MKVRFTIKPRGLPSKTITAKVPSDYCGFQGASFRVSGAFIEAMEERMACEVLRYRLPFHRAAKG
jgi:hypothetical protein